MASFNNFVLCILLTISLILVTEAAQERQEITSEEEKKERDRQLKAINKPAIKSFKTEQGDIYDCIDIHKQLAFDHHLLKNHSVQLKLTIMPEWTTRNNISRNSGPLPLLQEGINCPDGTVIVKRTTMQDLINAKRLRSMGFGGPAQFFPGRNNTDSTGHHFALVDYRHISVSGVKGKLNLWSPEISEDQFSLAFMAVTGGPPEQVDSISVGWMVNPTLYLNDHVRFFAYWTAHASMTGCYDIRCPGFVQVSKKIPLGAFVDPVSIYGGPQYELDLSLYQDLVKGDWWLAYGDENVGYWPATLFMASGLAKRANYASWGGHAYSPLTEKSPVMGSGHWPALGIRKAAYVNRIKVIDGSGKVKDPRIGGLHERESSRNCYRAIHFNGGYDPWLRAVFFGGPGGCKGK